MKKRRIGEIRVGSLILLCSLLLFYSGFAHAQENWVFTYDGPGPNDESELAYSIFYGIDGNIYAAGFISSGAVAWDISVASMTPAGDTNWTYQYDVGFMDWAFSIVQGSDYNIYVAGFVTDNVTYDEDLFVMSLNPTTGDTNWTYRYNGPGYANDEAASVVYGLDGNVYAAGFSTGSGTIKDFTVISLDPATGAANWIYRYDGPGNLDDEAWSIVYGADGNLYAAGYSTGSTTQKDFMVMGLDPSTGDTTWTYQYNGPEDLNDEAWSVVYGADGKVYAAGYSTGSVTQRNFMVMGLDPSTGDTTWTYLYNGPADLNDEARSVVYGADGKVYAAGYSMGSGNQKDFMVMSLDTSTVDTTWTFRYNGPGNSLDEARSVVYGLNGDIYAAGCITRSDANKDFAVVRLDTEGDSLWFYRYDGSVSSEAWPVIYGSDDNLYAAGYSTGNVTGEDFTVISLPANFPPKIPVLVSPKNAGFSNDTVVTFIWRTSSDPETFVDGYVLQYALESGFASPESMITSDTFYTATLNDTTYYWRVKAEDSEGSQSDWSDVWSFSFDLDAPETPVLLSPIDDTILADNSVTFSWSTVRSLKGHFDNAMLERQRGAGDNPPSPVKYVIQIDTVSSLPSPIIDDTFDVNTANYDLAGDLMYYWQVKAFDLAGNESPYADAESFIIDLSPPVIDSTTVWEDTTIPGPFDVYTKVADISSVDRVVLWFQRIEDRPLWISREMNEATGDWYFEQIPQVNLEIDTIHYYIYAVDIMDFETYTETLSFAVDVTGISEFEGIPVSFSFGLKNNPAKGKAMFNVALPEAALIKLRIYDVSGRLIEELINAQWPAGYYDVSWTSNVSSGVYFYSFESPWQYKAGKLVMIK